MIVTVKVKCEAEWTEARTYDLGDCTTRREMELALDRMVDDDTFDDMLDADWEIEASVTRDPSGVWEKPPEPIPWTDPAEDRHWLSFGGRRWVGDGTFAAREDGPRPLSIRGEYPENPGYIESGRLSNQLLTELICGPTYPEPWTGYTTFSARMAPLLQAGTVEAVGGQMGAFRVTRDGEAVAIVMGMRDSKGTIGLDGEVLQGGTQ